MDGEDAIPLLERKDREADSDHESEGPVEEEQNSVVDEGSSLTARVWILGSLLCVMGSAISQLFFFKSNAPSLRVFTLLPVILADVIFQLFVLYHSHLAPAWTRNGCRSPHPSILSLRWSDFVHAESWTVHSERSESICNPLSRAGADHLSSISSSP